MADSVETEPMVLEADLRLSAAAPLATALRALRGADINIDASQVERLGGLCLQALLAAEAAWEADGNRFEITSPSAEFTRDLKLLGAQDALGLSEESL